MTKIKIHDEAWFKKHCLLSKEGAAEYRALRPKGAYWRKQDKEVGLVYWLSGNPMNFLAGKVLAVESDNEDVNSGEIYSTRYFACGYWIPNWAIEWVMEEAE